MGNRLGKAIAQLLFGALVWLIIILAATCGSAIIWPTGVGAQEPAPIRDARGGICALNTGQLVREDSAFVRAGNSGWDYSCLWVQYDIGDSGGLWAGLTFAPTRIFSWEKRDPLDEISRYSWRPGYHIESTGEKSRHSEVGAIWVAPEVGWLFKLSRGEIRPSIGLLWLTNLSYRFGAPWGPDLPFVSLDLAYRALGPFYVGVNGRLVYKRPHGLTVLEDWAGHHSGPDWKPHQKVIQTVEAKIGVAF